MKISISAATLVCTVVMVAVPSLLRGDATFSDGTFNDSNWTVTSIQSGGFGGVVDFAGQVASGETRAAIAASTSPSTVVIPRFLASVCSPLRFTIRRRKVPSAQLIIRRMASPLLPSRRARDSVYSKKALSSSLMPCLTSQPARGRRIR
jgi:hypothetical protein